MLRPGSTSSLSCWTRCCRTSLANRTMACSVASNRLLPRLRQRTHIMPSIIQVDRKRAYQPGCVLHPGWPNGKSRQALDVLQDVVQQLHETFVDQESSSAVAQHAEAVSGRAHAAVGIARRLGRSLDIRSYLHTEGRFNRGGPNLWPGERWAAWVLRLDPVRSSGDRAPWPNESRARIEFRPSKLGHRDPRMPRARKWRPGQG
jgi:hypothetical protein